MLQVTKPVGGCNMVPSFMRIRFLPISLSYMSRNRQFIGAAPQLERLENYFLKARLVLIPIQHFAGERQPGEISFSEASGFVEISFNFEIIAAGVSEFNRPVE